MNNAYNSDVRRLNFEYLKNTRYDDVYKMLGTAKKLYETDKSACCTRLRTALEVVIEEIVEICGLKYEKQNNINGNLDILRNSIPEYLRLYCGEDIIKEMDTVRFNGNGATHYNINNNFDLDKATHTSWIAMEKICKWVSGFEPVYKSYLAHNNRQDILSSINDKQKEEKKGFLDKYGDCIGAGLCGLVLAWVFDQDRNRRR